MLDCETEKGVAAIESVSQMVGQLTDWSMCRFVPTDKTCFYDYWLIKDGRLVAIAECKSRNLSLESLKKFGSYLITEEKLKLGIKAATALGVSFYVIVILELSNMVVFWKICGPSGRPCCVWETKQTETQATVNGGKAFRKNAYIELTDMMIRKL